MLSIDLVNAGESRQPRQSDSESGR